MRVLAVGNIYPPHAPGGGYELTWRSAMAHLRERGDAVRVLASVHREPGVAADALEDPDVHRELPWYWREHEFPRTGWRERIAIERSAGAVLRGHLDEFEPDVVCWWGMGGMCLGLVELVRRAGIPAVGVVGDEWMVWGPRVDAWQRGCRRLGPAAAVAERMTGLPARIELGTAAVWLFNSEEVRRRSLAAGWQLADARVEHPGIDDVLFATRPPREEWGWRLLYLGRMDERKGVHVAVRALPLLPEATLVIQGRGDPAYVERLRALADELGVLGRIEFSAAPRERLVDVYADADVLLFPVQWDEPWGLVPLEAMAVGRPVVASGTGGSAEYLRHEENCLVYSPRGSAEELAGSVRRLAADPALRGRLHQGGLATAPRFTERRYNEAIAGALDEVAAGGGARAEGLLYPAAG
ncbi:MAG TPA: glycosyltransferase family 4 protein [Thermoleophilaceae bacterium]|nr:glycosyltransferase family 4 protein [Thermoleophilaceae bacterium]